MAKYFILILCFALPVLLVAEEVQVEIGNTEAVLDVIQGNAETTLEIINNADDAEVEILQGDTIKILQEIQEVIVEIVSGDKDALVEAIEEKPGVSYFIKDISEETSDGQIKGVCILEIRGKIDELEDGFYEITQEQIHTRGYLTPTEAAAQSSHRDEGATDHETWYSWCDAYPYNGAKMVSAGSHTERATLGWVYTKGRLIGRNLQGFNYDRTKTCKNILGWAATVSFQIFFISGYNSSCNLD